MCVRPMCVNVSERERGREVTRPARTQSMLERKEHQIIKTPFTDSIPHISRKKTGKI